MKKTTLCALALCAALLAVSAVPAPASAVGEPGFYNVGEAPSVEIVPLTEAGEPVSAVTRNVDGRPGDETFYPGSAELRVTLSATQTGAMYLLTVSEGETVLYVDQQTGGGQLSFRAAFPAPAQRTDLTLRIGSNAEGFAPVTAALSYTPGAEGYAACPRDGRCVTAAYADLDPAAWYHDGVHYALETGIMNGVGDGRFAPSGTASRAMVVTMLWRMEGEPAADGDAGFADVPAGAWYAGAVRWAASEGIVNGYSPTVFAPNDNVSRQQLAAILCRYAAYLGMDTDTGSKYDLGAFLDAEQVASWAAQPMQWAVSAKLIGGVGNEKLSPAADASRAQVATVLMRFAAL